MKRILISLILAVTLTSLLSIHPSAGGPGGKMESSTSPPFSIGIVPHYSSEQIWHIPTSRIDHLNKTTSNMAIRSLNDLLEKAFAMLKGSRADVLNAHRIKREIMHEDQ